MPRFLAPNGRAGDLLEPDDEGRPSARGYLSKPARPLQGGDSPETVARIAAVTCTCDEPEMLDAEDWKRHIQPRADQTEQQRRTVEEIARDRAKQQLSQEERIRKAHAEAQAKRRDVSREMWVLRQMTSKGQKPEKVEKPLQALERIAYLGRAA